ncbi:MAG: helix-turn-helix transcriptional regulator, partial [Bacteroidales bacterium]|nr:helix-turn-helix transcriptional regulator [Bacteroidales bacterium]
GISSAAVSNWEKGKSDPSGERLKKLAEYFGVDEGFILGYGKENPVLFVPENPKISGKSETDQIIERILQQLEDQPKTQEARILAKGVDKLPQEQREQALAVFRAVFANHAEDFEKGKDDDDT